MSVELKPVVDLPQMSEEEFAAWCDEDTRAEFVDGTVALMSPVSRAHYQSSKFLLTLLEAYLQQRPLGELLGPEVAVRLRAGLRRVPDLLFVAAEHAGRIRETLVEGAPDAVWEIISPESEERDWREKFPEYEAAGVREYWLVNPLLRTAYLYRLNAEGRYERVEEADERLVSEAIPGFWLKPAWLWQEPRPRILDCLRELGALE